MDRRVAAVVAYLREADSICWTPAPRGRSGFNAEFVRLAF